MCVDCCDDRKCASNIKLTDYNGEKLSKESNRVKIVPSKAKNI